MPQVSVLLPVRDAISFLGPCLSSLAAQTLEDHEVVAVDDGSTDGSRERLESAGDPRVRVLLNPGRGLVAALNAGLQAVRSPLVARMDADDVAHPDRLRIQVARLSRDGGVDILGSRVRLVGAVPGGNAGMEAYVRWSNELLEPRSIEEEFLVESPLVHPSVAMRTEAVRSLGGYRDGAGPEDYELWLRARAAGLRFAKTEETLLDWRDRPDRLTRKDPRYLPERFRDLKIDALLAGPLLSERPVVLWGAGPVGKAFALALAARGRPVSAFVEVDPRKIGQVIHGAPVLPVPEARREGALHLAGVGNGEARRRIRQAAADLGIAREDMIAVA